MFVGTQKMEYAIVRTLFPQMLKIVNISSLFMATGTVYAQCFWQSNRHTECWTTTDLFHYTFLLHLPFLPPPRIFDEVLCGTENSPNFPLAETRLSEQTPPLAPSHGPASSCIATTVCKWRGGAPGGYSHHSHFVLSPEVVCRASLKPYEYNHAPTECNGF